jgi:predicted hotdog family 3-hydroxylacyl-ACP dehydratase
MNRDEICARIPHSGSMCLLDRVLAWDATHIECRAVSHRDPANPLRRADRLAGVCGIEYAAQAMALHGSLLTAADAPPTLGYLASLRDVSLEVERLDDVAEELTVRAERLTGDANGFLYRFDVTAGERLLLRGRSAVKLLGTLP